MTYPNEYDPETCKVDTSASKRTWAFLAMLHILIASYICLKSDVDYLTSCSVILLSFFAGYRTKEYNLVNL